MEINSSQSLLTESVNQAVDDTSLRTDSLEGIIEATYKKFINNKLDDFPRMCEVARVQNLLKMKEMEEHGFNGKFERDTYGFSNNREFHWEFDIPQDLYTFMQSLVYKDFWSTENKRIYRAFMNAVCRGDDPMELLIKTKKIYGSNSDRSLTK